MIPRAAAIKYLARDIGAISSRRATSVSEAKRVKELETENSKLKKLLAEAELDKAALKELLSRKW